MGSFDKLFETSSRSLARHTSRRSMLGTLGQILTGAALIPLLPVDRSSRAQAAEQSGTGKDAHAAPNAAANTSAASKSATHHKTDDPTSCEYWKYCAIDGFLCSCCGGSSTACPPGTQPSPITWIGTCHNPADKRDYIVSYNDCCGKTSCGDCECNRNEREKPVYRPSRNNDLDWCMANGSDTNYHCSVSVILGVSESPK
jgi:methylamine dehydrogenase light chain